MRVIEKIKPIVSIIVAVYNTEEFLENTVKSICAQTITEIQIILVDDASTDESVRCCERLVKEDCRIEIYKHEKNRGVSAARNTGLLHAKGKYILFVDSDDYIDADMIETLLQLMDRTEIDMTICGYYINNVPQFGNVNEKTEMDSLECAKAIAGFQGSLAKGYVVNKLFKRELINFNQLKFDEYIHICEDATFCYQYVKCCRKIKYDPSPKYHYVRRKGSAMNGRVTEKRMSVLDTYPIILEIGRSYKDKELNEILEVNYYNHYVSILKDMMKQPSHLQSEYGDRVFPCIKEKLIFLLASKHVNFKRKVLIFLLRIGYPIWRRLIG